MKTSGFEDGGILTTGTTISDPHTWFISLFRQIREILQERRNPTPPAIARSSQIPTNDSGDQDIFATGTRISDPNPWFLLLTRQIRETLKERRNPTPRAVITAQSDPRVLDKLVDPPFQLASLFSLIKGIINDKLHPHHIEITATPVDVEELWTKRKYRVPAILSVLTHVGVVGVLLYVSMTSQSKHKFATDSSVLMEPIAVYLPPSAVKSSGDGGGGGGAKAPTPASRGVLPRASDKQLAPPAPIIKNMAPELMAEMTIIAPHLSNLPNLSSLLPVGDPNGVIGPPSAGPGSGFGIGNGDGHGIGAGNGPGFGPGSVGGTAGDPYRVGKGEGKASAPICNTVDPNYSDDARKAHIQGTVVLDSIVQKDGSIDVSRVSHSLGYGLDDEAKKALSKWKCDPGRVNGQAVPVQLQIVINFHLY